MFFELYFARSSDWPICTIRFTGKLWGNYGPIRHPDAQEFFTGELCLSVLLATHLTLTMLWMMKCNDILNQIMWKMTWTSMIFIQCIRFLVHWFAQAKHAMTHWMRMQNWSFACSANCAQNLMPFLCWNQH